MNHCLVGSSVRGPAKAGAEPQLEASNTFPYTGISDISESKRDFIVAHHGDCRPLARKRGQAISDSKSIYISHHFRISRYDMI